MRAADFARWQGHEAKIELGDLIERPQAISRADRGERRAKASPSASTTRPKVPTRCTRLPLSALAEAKLVMTDRLLDMAASDQDLNETLDDPDIETVAYDPNRKLGSTA